MTKLEELKEKGCCILEGILDKNLTDHCIRVSHEALNNLTPEHRIKNKSQGSMIHIGDYPKFSKLIGSSSLIQSLIKNFNFSDIRFSSGYLISKPAKSPPLFWHQDWWGWEHKSSYTDFIHQIFVMVYLTDTNLENGCLKFIPGSHKAKHDMHSSKNAHSEELSRVQNPNDTLFANKKDEENIQVKVGDVVVGDARVLHAANSNKSNNERSLITLWYHPHYDSLPDDMRSRIYHLYERLGEEVETDSGGMSPSKWQDEDLRLIKHLAPDIEKAQPTPWQRQPKW